ncbi:MAG: malonyl-CoA decarboxylase family protein, partial [Pseudomonadota bacterium]|nr:malonyl-CoA decarboxylase family protein [Pseudomonadota bacterium]
NCAAVLEVHDASDASPKGAEQSYGVMVNYHYDLSQTERNHEDFALNQTIAASKSIKARARAAQTQLPAPQRPGPADS